MQQYADLLEHRARAVQEQNETDKPVDLRTGWLLWQESLRQFLYFEEPVVAPNPEAFYAEWHERPSGARKGSRNLWIYEKDTGRKRYSVTTSAGAKIQPYFDVPPPNDPNLYLFTVIGERVEGGVRTWITRRTASDLERVVGSLDADAISSMILTTAAEISADDVGPESADLADDVVSLVISEEAYEELRSALPAVNDELCFQLLIDYLSAH